MARLAAMLATGTMLAGCSSGVMRFQDGIFTGSTANQRSIIKNSEYQPYPGDVAAAPAPAPVDDAYTGSVNRAAVTPVEVAPQPVQRSALAPVATEPALAPVAAPAQKTVWQTGPAPLADARPALDRTVTGSAAPRPVEAAEAPAPVRVETAVVTPPAAKPAAIAADDADGGWSRAGGTEVTVREGETVYNLSRRFGVPAASIVKANGLASADSLRSGQKVVIPTYVYSRKAPVSAPDATPEVAEAKSSRGSRYDVPNEKVPLPSSAPEQKLAILPQAPKPKDKQAAPAETAASPAPAAKPEPVVARTEAPRVIPMTAPAAKPEVAAAPKPEIVAVARPEAPKPQPVEAKVEKPSKPAAPAGGYTVVAGDSLYAIARKTGVKAADIRAANGLGDKPLQIGQTLAIPAGGSTVAAAPVKVDPVVTAAVKPVKPARAAAEDKQEPSPVTAYTPPKAEDQAIEEAVEKSAAVAPDATGVGRMRWPVRGRVIADYGRSGGKSSDGIDIAVPEGTPVKAAENGVVIYAGDGLKEFGNTVLVRHEDGLVTVYGHAAELKVSRGEKVKRGQEIARSGMTGSADSPKLHFEVRKDSSPVDPSGYLE